LHFISHELNLIIAAAFIYSLSAIGNDSRIVDEILDGTHMGLFELGVHGWSHTDYTKLSKVEQKSSLQRANEKNEIVIWKYIRYFYSL
jgi:peptidoglycan/xylan/chitin deacetylase (PgdA/CDA1 family)